MLKIIGKILLWILAIIGALTIAVLIYYSPVIDRLIRPCYYYPNAFIDCVPKKEGITIWQLENSYYS
jgi:hypothetical protein